MSEKPFHLYSLAVVVGAAGHRSDSLAELVPYTQSSLLLTVSNNQTQLLSTRCLELHVDHRIVTHAHKMYCYYCCCYCLAPLLLVRRVVWLIPLMIPWLDIIVLRRDLCGLLMCYVAISMSSSASTGIIRDGDY